jgi:hypothetical protein
LICLQVGQQQPRMRVAPPGLANTKEVEENRLVAWVHRELRKKQHKLARDDAAGRPSINIQVRCPKKQTFCRTFAVRTLQELC